MTAPAGAGLRVHDARLALTVRDGGRENDPELRGPVLQRYEYDGGGRVTRVATKDAAIEYVDYDMLGSARLVRMIRYQDGSGFTTGTELDRHAMEYRRNVFGEVVQFRMPAAGIGSEASLLPPGTAAGWLGWISQNYDPAGNLVEQRSPRCYRCLSRWAGINRDACRRGGGRRGGRHFGGLP